MDIKIYDLDDEIKEELRTKIMRRLFKAYGTLPLASEDSKILAIVEEVSTNNYLREVITDYYKKLSVKDITVSIQPTELVQVYLHRV